MTSIKTRTASPTNIVAATFRAAAMVPAASAAVVIAAAAAATAPTAAIAQEPMKFAEPDPDRFPPNTLVARYQIDPAVLESVTNTAEPGASVSRTAAESAEQLPYPIRDGLRREEVRQRRLDAGEGQVPISV